MRRMVLFLVLLLAVMPSVFAQEGELACTNDDITAAIENARAALDEAETALDGGDAAEAVNLLAELRSALADTDIACNGRLFEGRGTGVAGPMELPAGVYRVKLTTNGITMVDNTVLSGNCDEYFFLSTTSMGEETSEALFESRGCRVAFEVTLMMGGNWTMTVESLE